MEAKVAREYLESLMLGIRQRVQPILCVLTYSLFM